MTKKVLACAFIILVGSQLTFCQFDSTAIFRLTAINVSSITGSFQTRTPTYASFVKNFGKSNTLTLLGNGFAVEENADFSSSHSGFRITFNFQSDWLDQHRFFDFFTLAFETGSQELNLFRLTDSDSSSYDYRMDNEAFRLTLGGGRIRLLHF